MKNKKIFCRNSHPDVFSNKGPLKYLTKLTGKQVYKSLFVKKFQDAGLQLHLKRGSCIDFFCEIFKTLQNSFFIALSLI